MLNRLKKLARSSKKFLLITAGVSVLSASLVSGAQAVPVYFFGDSLTDSGYADNSALAAGKGPIYTTFGGYVWSQYVAHDLAPELYSLPNYATGTPADTLTNNKLGSIAPYTSAVISGTKNGVNYASAGSAVLDSSSIPGVPYTPPTLAAQIHYYLQTHNYKADPNAVYFIWAGSNDFLGLVLQPNISMTALQTGLNNLTVQVPFQIASQVAVLAASGANKIVVMSLPDIGLTPFANSPANKQKYHGLLPGIMSGVSSGFNGYLNLYLSSVANQPANKGKYIAYIDLASKLDAIYNSNPHQYTVAGQTFTFANISTPACFLPTSAADTFAITCPAVSPNGGSYNDYLFADQEHPAGQTGRMVSLIIEQCIKNAQTNC